MIGRFPLTHRWLRFLCLFFACACGQLGNIVINELDVASSGTQYSEFIELKNIGSNTVNTKDYQIRHFTYSAELNQVFLADVQNLIDFDLTPGSYFVLCVYSSKALLCSQSVRNNGVTGTVITQFWLSDQNATVELHYINPTNNQTTLLDRVGYDSTTMNPAYYQGEAPAVGDLSTVLGVSISRFPDGQNTNNNFVDFRQVCRTPGLPNVANLPPGGFACAAAADGNLVLNELDYTQPNGDNNEFIEIQNRSNRNYTETPFTQTTSGFRIRILTPSNTSVWTILVNTPSFPFNADIRGYFVICIRNSSRCTGSNARPLCIGGAINNPAGCIPRFPDWIPNPNATVPFYSLQLTQEGCTLISLKS